MLKDFLKKRGLKRWAPVMLSGLVSVAGLTGQAAEKPAAQSAPKTVQKTQNLYQQLLKMKAQRQTALINLMKREVAQHEGQVAHPYFDTKGYLTVGRGLNISTWAEFDSLDFQTKDGKILSREQKALYFKSLYQLRARQAKKGFNYQAKYYKKLCVYEATPASLDKRETQKLQSCLASLEKKCRSVGVGFYDLALEAQYAMMDMEYNLGAAGFSTKAYQNFWTLGVAKKDYAKMAEESGRKGISKERNAAIAQLFKNGGKRRVLQLDTLINKTAEQQHLPLRRTIQQR